MATGSDEAQRRPAAPTGATQPAKVFFAHAIELCIPDHTRERVEVSRRVGLSALAAGARAASVRFLLTQIVPVLRPLAPCALEMFESVESDSITFGLYHHCWFQLRVQPPGQSRSRTPIAELEKQIAKAFETFMLNEFT